MPIKYECGDCGANGVKLWREYNTFLEHITLRCARCAEKNQKKTLDLLRSDQIGWLIPAVPTPNKESFWGYTSIPQKDVEWWKRLPLRDDPFIGGDEERDIPDTIVLGED